MCCSKTSQPKLQNYETSKTNCETFHDVQNFCELAGVIRLGSVRLDSVLR